MGNKSQLCPNDAQLSAFLDGELNAEASSEIQGHLRSCACCSAVFRDMKSANDLLIGYAPFQEPSARIKYNLMRRIRQHEDRRAGSLGFSWRGAFPGFVRTFAHRLWIPALAAFLLLVLPVSLQEFRNHRENHRLLSEIERFKSDWVSRVPLSKNPFDLDGNLFGSNEGNPFAHYLNER